jgi:hypothetical protein
MPFVRFMLFIRRPLSRWRDRSSGAGLYRQNLEQELSVTCRETSDPPRKRPWSPAIQEKTAAGRSGRLHVCRVRKRSRVRSVAWTASRAAAGDRKYNNVTVNRSRQ